MLGRCLIYQLIGSACYLISAITPTDCWGKRRHRPVRVFHVVNLTLATPNISGPDIGELTGNA